ncbi:phasin family protein [Janthinobacterium sp. RB2R34]|uniref:phasin family protein n=1 Tax=Janthinobacterium sp. RB2R34 TaxID=3424193 RepID=UPI003F26A468
MFPLPEQLSSAAKSQWETQLQLFSTFGHTVFDGAEKIIALHLDASKAAMAKTADTAQHLLAANDARELLSYSSSQAQPAIESVLAYSRQLFGIASNTQAQLLQAAKARVDGASTVASAPVQVHVEAIVEVPAAAPAPATAAAVEPEPAPAAVLAPVAEPEPAAPAPLPLAATLPIAASAPEAIAPPPAAVKATAKAAPAPAASKPASSGQGTNSAKPAAKGKRK